MRKVRHATVVSFTVLGILGCAVGLLAAVLELGQVPVLVLGGASMFIAAQFDRDGFGLTGLRR